MHYQHKKTEQNNPDPHTWCAHGNTQLPPITAWHARDIPVSARCERSQSNACWCRNSTMISLLCTTICCTECTLHSSNHLLFLFWLRYMFCVLCFVFWFCSVSCSETSRVYINSINNHHHHSMGWRQQGSWHTWSLKFKAHHLFCCSTGVGSEVYKSMGFVVNLLFPLAYPYYHFVVRIYLILMTEHQGWDWQMYLIVWQCRRTLVNPKATQLLYLGHMNVLLKM